MYNKKLIPPDYARVIVTWTHNDYEEEGIDFPTEERDRYIRGIQGACVLWNKEDIVLDMPTPRSHPSDPPMSPPGDDDDSGDDGDGNDNAGGPGSSPRRSPPPDTSKPQGGNETPPASGPKEGKGQCPPAPKKPSEEAGGRPENITPESWAAFNIANEFRYSMTFERYIC
jgi:hypothetical protein